jgi:hypothetical protein
MLWFRRLFTSVVAIQHLVECFSAAGNLDPTFNPSSIDRT